MPQVQEWMLKAADEWIFKETGVHNQRRVKVIHLASIIASEYAEAHAPATPATCPKCGGSIISTSHGFYCPKDTCKWGWEAEMDGSPLTPATCAHYQHDWANHMHYCFTCLKRGYDFQYRQRGALLDAWPKSSGKPLPPRWPRPRPLRPNLHLIKVTWSARPGHRRRNER